MTADTATVLDSTADSPTVVVSTADTASFVSMFWLILASPA